MEQYQPPSYYKIVIGYLRFQIEKRDEEIKQLKKELEKWEKQDIKK